MSHRTTERPVRPGSHFGEAIRPAGGRRSIARERGRAACRHGLAHLLAGDLDVGEGADVRFMSSILEFMSVEERTADCFALARSWACVPAASARRSRSSASASVLP